MVRYPCPAKEFTGNWPLTLGLSAQPRDSDLLVFWDPEPLVTKVSLFRRKSLSGSRLAAITYMT